MEYKVKFEDGPHPNFLVYALDLEKGRLYGCDVQLNCQIDGEDLDTSIKKRNLEGILPVNETELREVVFDGLRKAGTNCIKVSKREEIEKVVIAHRDSYIERFTWEANRLMHHIRNIGNLNEY